MDEKLHFFLVSACIGFMLGCAVGGLGGRYTGMTTMKADAVQHGAAHWTADKDGNAVFEWLTKKEQK